jgi:hypothetical protein
MNPINSNILIGKKDAAFFAANPTLVLLDGQLLYNENTGELFIGDGVTQLNALSPINSGFTPTGTNTQYIAGDGSYINFPTDVSYFNNDAGYLDSGDIGVSVQPYDSDTTLLGNGTSGDEIVLTTSSNQLTSLGLNAGESIRRNALNTAYEGFTPFAASGTSAQYIAGDGTYLTFPTNVSTFTNDSGYLTSTSAGLLYQPLDSDLTSWAGVTRASGFDTFTTTPSSANLRSLVTDETGTGALVFGTSPTISTTLTVTAGSSTTIIRDLVSTPTAGAIYLNQSSPSISNYTLMDDTSSLYLNARASNSIYIQSNTSNIVRFGPSFQIYTPIASASGSFATFTFTKPNNTTQTASANIQGWLFTTGSRQWNTGAITTQQEFLITSPTYSFVGASTITNAYSLFVNAPTAGTNATITNSYSAGFSGNVILSGVGDTVNHIGKRILRVFQDTAWMDLGSLVGATSVPVIYFLQTAPSISNYGIGGNTTDTFVNATTNLYLRISNTDQLTIQSNLITVKNGLNFSFNTATGTKIGTATNQRIGFWNATPIVQPTTGVAAAAFVANAGTAVNDASTFDGYTISQVVKALRNTGLLA